MTEHAPDGRCFPCFQRAGRLARLFDGAGITQRHAKILTWESLATNMPAHSRAVAAVRAFLADPDASILAVIGARGLGKTQIGVVAVGETIRATLKPAQRIHVLDLLDDLKSRIGEPAGEADWRAEWAGPTLLVIDEVTQRVANAWTMFNLSRLLDRRYENMVKTLLLGNVERDDLAAVIGASAADRMNEGGGVIVCDWPSFRQRGDRPAPDLESANAESQNAASASVVTGV